MPHKVMKPLRARIANVWVRLQALQPYKSQKCETETLKTADGRILPELSVILPDAGRAKDFSKTPLRL